MHTSCEVQSQHFMEALATCGIGVSCFPSSLPFQLGVREKGVLGPCEVMIARGIGGKEWLFALLSNGVAIVMK